MSEKHIFYDSDVLICFLEINKQGILKRIFSKIIVPDVVYLELNKKNSNQNVKNNLASLINDGFVEIRPIEFGTPEYFDYTCMIEGFWSDDEPIGFGEAAAMALAIKDFGIVASNNLADVEELGKANDIPILTFSMIMAFCFELNIMSKQEIESVWKEILDNTKQKLPKETFNEYFNELFENDCVRLLKNYNFKRHYSLSQKRKKAEI